MSDLSDIFAKELRIHCVMLGMLGLARLYYRWLDSVEDRMINQSYGLDLNFQPLAC